MSPHALTNRAYWQAMHEKWVGPGRRGWEGEMKWGIWSVPESRLQIFGDLEKLRGLEVIELGCGTAYFSSWFARLGAKPTGIDITPGQLATARAFQAEFGIEFPLIEGTAEQVPLPDASFDLAFSEYGASIWCDPYKWIPEARRLLRPGGRLVFLRNSTLAALCYPEDEDAPPGTTLMRSYEDLERMDWGTSVEFQLPPGKLLRLLRDNGFNLENLVEVFPGEEATADNWFMTLEWARRWPSEEVWVASSPSL